MKKKILNTLLAGAAIATMAATTAQAGPLDAVAGEVSFQFTGWDAAQSSYNPAYKYDGTVSADGDVLCGTFDECDTLSSQGFAIPPAAGTGAAAAPGASGSDDTYGLAKVNTIIDINTATSQWNDGDGGDVLVAYFYGFRDETIVRLSAAEIEFYSQGGVVDIYRTTNAFYLDLLDGDTTDQSTIAAKLGTLPASDLYLRLVFQTDCTNPDGLLPATALEASATLCGDFNATANTGGSDGNAMAMDGSAIGKYPNNFFFTQRVEPCSSGTQCSGATSFNLRVRDGSATTTALPAPGALALFGLGLVGMGLLGRRRKA